MQNSFEKDESAGASVAAEPSAPPVAGERVFTEPIDEYGIILLETRIAPDGTKRTRYVSRKGRPVITLEEREAMECPYPPEPDCWA